MGPRFGARSDNEHSVRSDRSPLRGLKGRELLDRVWTSVQQFGGEGRQNLTRLLDEVEHSRNLRVFDTIGTILPLFWYAAIIGYLLTA